MKRLVLAVLAVFILAGIAGAQTTLDLKGFIRVQGELNNFGYGPYGLNNNVTNFKPFLKDDDKLSAFIDQRTRMFFNLKSGENLGGTVAFEIDTRWGDNSATVGRNQGGAIGADSINLETKNAFFWYKPSDNLKLTFGLQGFSDEFNGILFFGTDMAGIRADYTISKDSSLLVGYYILRDVVADADDTTNLDYVGPQDATYFIPVTYKTTLGDGKLSLAYYRIVDNEGKKKINEMAKGADDFTVNYLGATYVGKAGSVDYGVSALYNFGEYKNGGDINGYALQAQAGVKVGPGKLRARLLYTSGDDNATDNDYDGFVTQTYNDLTSSIPLCCNDLMFLVRSLEESINHSAAILQDISGYGRGVLLAYLSYDQNINDKTNVQVTVANARFNERKAGGPEGGKELGTEIDLFARYKLEKNLSLTLGAGYFMLGSAYDKTDSGKDPSDLYKLFARLTYTF